MSENARHIAGEIGLRRKRGKRFIVAIAGAPGAGKSTLADDVCALLNAAEAGSAAVLPMDGFHLDNAVLDTLGLRARKGAPQTFDADGYAALLDRIGAGDRDIVVPVFDRTNDVARAGGRIVSKETQVIITEGNYLLLDRPEWAQARAHFDLSVFLDVPIAELERRLVQRWLDHGMDEKAAKAKASGNDIANATLVANNSVPADLVLAQ